MSKRTREDAMKKDLLDLHAWKRQQQQHVTFKNETGVCALNTVIINLFYLEHLRNYIVEEAERSGKPLYVGLRTFFLHIIEHRDACDVEDLFSLLQPYCEEFKSGGADPLPVWDCLFCALYRVKTTPFIKAQMPIYFEIKVAAENWNSLQQYLQRTKNRIRDKNIARHHIVCMRLNRKRALKEPLDIGNSTFFDPKYFNQLYDLRPFTFPLRLSIEGRVFVLYSIFIISFRQGSSFFGAPRGGLHSTLLLHGKWENDYEWMEFDNNRNTLRTLEYMKKMSESETPSFSFAESLFYVEESIYNTFEWTLPLKL